MSLPLSEPPLGEGLVLLDASGRIVTCNAVAERLVGYPRSELVGLSNEDERWVTVLPDGTPVGTDQVPSAVTLRTGRPVEGVLLGIRHPGTRPRWVRVSTMPMPPPTGGVVVTLCEVSDSVVAERERSDFFSAGLDIFCIARVDGEILHINPAVERILGWPLAHVRGANYLHFVHADDLERTRAAGLHLAENGGTLTDFRNRYRCFDGTYRWLSWNVFALARERIFYATARDVTVERGWEDRLLRQVHDSQVMMDAVAEGIYAKDREGRCTYANTSAATILGYPPGSFLGQPIHDLIHHSRPEGDPLPLEECALYQHLQRGGPAETIETTYWTRDGRPVPVECTSNVVVEGGAVVGAVVTFRDMSERRAMERLKDELVSIVSHELRTPLTALRGALGLLAGGVLGEVAPQAKRMLDIATGNTERLIRLTNDILALERLKSGHAELDLRPCNLRDVLATALEAVRPLAAQAGVDIRLQSVDRELRADEDRLIQLVTNLVTNAIKFSDTGSEVLVSGMVDGPFARLEVRDHGRGIPPDMHAVIFERFAQVDASDSRDKGGTGLGLAICKAIVQQHGGRIWVESDLGRGSRFHVELPLGQDGGVVPLPLV